MENFKHNIMYSIYRYCNHVAMCLIYYGMGRREHCAKTFLIALNKCYILCYKIK